MAYITVYDIKDKTINNAITQSGWTDSDLQLRIDEAEAIIDAYLIKAGYKKTDLETCPLVKRINVLLAKYNVLRDLYANVSPTKVEDKGFAKWKEEAMDLLFKISNREISLIDASGNVISYNVAKEVPIINTENVERIFKIGANYTWSKPTANYSDEEVIGEK